ncbi:butyryl-coa dehydrogenase [Heliomicrobium modesticaldum Ice1]|uniref:Butyryl-coa dehydrogenase n=1 Tax=Heliobacterium modesticaldum (strain ATCC 51547 / Ice1) TaxID=498761 RepID=B0TAL9_HELMI|nr:acyl-CoA dehydrogenase [Heliomicrobium modesticaldum]ABZ83671.1 butyryl-coa dehydrogenase [Heliomicrobium modesticaldum Ice1]
MDFTLNEEQELFLEMVRKFTRNEVAAAAEGVDREHRFPRETIAKMGELGLLGLTIPEEYGGSGGDYLSYVLMIEELAKVCASTAVIVAVHTGLACTSIACFGTEAQREKYLAPLAAGEIIGAYALTEPNAGSDAASLTLMASDEGEYWRLNGNKVFITNASEAGLFITFVRTDPASRGAEGITCLIVERDTPGMTVSRPVEKMGLNGSVTCELHFDNALVPKENVLGDVGQGFKVAMQLLDGGRIAIAAQGLGIAEGALEYALRYIRQREQFGRPIAANQGIQWMVADLATEVDAARLLVYRAAWLKTMGKPHGKEAAMAKKFATDTAMRVTSDCVQLLGGYGYTREYPVERYMRDAKVTQIYEGTNQVQQMVIARHLLR